MEDGYVATNFDSGRRIRRRTYCFDRTQIFVGSEASITIVNRFPTHQIITELHRLAGGSIAEKAVSLPLNKLLGSKRCQHRC